MSLGELNIRNIKERKISAILIFASALYKVFFVKIMILSQKQWPAYRNMLLLFLGTFSVGCKSLVFFSLHAFGGCSSIWKRTSKHCSPSSKLAFLSWTEPGSSGRLTERHAITACIPSATDLHRSNLLQGALDHVSEE